MAVIRPSEDWSGFADLRSDSETFQLIQRIFSSADFDYLRRCGIDTRRNLRETSQQYLDCNINLTQFTFGRQNLILEIRFHDDVFWIARIPYRFLDDDTKTSLLSEIATIRILQQRTSIPVPQVFHFELSAEGPFKYPFILMECLPGRTLASGLAETVPRDFRRKVAIQFASVLAELQNITFDRIGRLWCGTNADQPVEIIGMDWHASKSSLDTSLEYFYAQRQHENRQIAELHPNAPEWLTACWVLSTALSHMVIEDRVRGPFPLCHMDLHFQNLLFDKEYNLTGVIDWTNAQAAPLEQLAVTPEFIIFPSRPEVENQPIVDFKDHVVKALEEMERKLKVSCFSISKQIGPVPSSKFTPLSAYLGTYRAEITLRQYMASPQGSLFAARMIAKLIYGERLSWEQLKNAYSTTPLL